MGVNTRDINSTRGTSAFSFSSKTAAVSGVDTALVGTAVNHARQWAELCVLHLWPAGSVQAAESLAAHTAGQRLRCQTPNSQWVASLLLVGDVSLWWCQLQHAGLQFWTQKFLHFSLIEVVSRTSICEFVQSLRSFSCENVWMRLPSLFEPIWMSNFEILRTELF